MGPAAYARSKIFQVRAELGVPWTSQFASSVFVATGAALVVGREGFGSQVGFEDAFADALVTVSRVGVMLKRSLFWRWRRFCACV
jgi:hypothetical protein